MTIIGSKIFKRNDFTVIVSQQGTDLKPIEIVFGSARKGCFFPGDAEHKIWHAWNEGLLKLDALLWFG